MKKISESSQAVIEQTQSKYSRTITELGSQLSNNFTRQTMTKALAGDVTAVQSLTELARQRNWIRHDDNTSIGNALEWIKLMRTVT